MIEPKLNGLPFKRLASWTILLAFCLCLLISPVPAQNAGRLKESKTAKAARKLGLDTLSEIKAILKREYYDPNFRGINLDERFKKAEERIKTLETYPQVYRAIAQVLIEFNDSHTGFSPPAMTKTVQYGFSWQMIGDKCYVVDVEKGSDAEVKGLRVGSIIAGMGSYNPRRENVWLLNYLLYRLDPQERLTILVQEPDGSERELLIQSKVRQTEDLIKAEEEGEFRKKGRLYKCKEINSDLIACKLYTFLVDKDIIDSMMKDVRKHKKFILDLRGNNGGHLATETHLTGYFFNHDVKIGNEVTRRKIEERIARCQKEKHYDGDLIVLIDSKSASASEVFARMIQIEKRGTVVGDISAGKVMISQYFPLQSFEAEAGYGLNVTVGDLIMSDGKRLEGVGVIPDKALGPTARALAEWTDPVLAYAAGVLGATLTPAQAGKFYFLRTEGQ